MSIQILNQYRNLVFPLYDGNSQASDALWATLYTRLSQDSLLSGYQIILNENGRILDRSISDLAALLGHAPVPTIWIDYCAWPLYYRPALWTAGQPYYWDASGFAEFVRALNTRLVARSDPSGSVGHEVPELSFDTPDASRYMLVNGLSVSVDLQTSPWRDDGKPDGGGFWVGSGYEVTGEKWLGYDQNTYGLFAIRSGRNWYFWGYGSARPGEVCVTADDYADYVHWAINLWKTGGSGPVQGPPAPAPSPGDGSDPGTGTVPGPGAAPGVGAALNSWWSQRTPTEKVAIIGGAVALIGGATILFHQPARPEG